MTYEAAESREVEVVSDVLVVHLAEELVALEAHEPRDPRHLLVVLLAARYLAAAAAAAVATALAVAARKQRQRMRETNEFTDTKITSD